ncbi:MAG: LamG domain-containing protein [Gammaproteobacteria bacterium]|nr:LamG domain-containing protein [Gammaproteobacteria bacterium]
MRPQNLGGTQRVMAIGDGFEGRFDSTALYDDFGYAGGTSLNISGFSDEVLRHVAFTWDTVTTEDGQAYLNGALDGTDTSGYNDTETGVIGMFSRNSNEFIGELYDIRIYDRILSAAEILTIYNSRGADSIVYGLLHRWTLDEGADGSTLSGTGVAKDRAQNQNNFSSASGAPDYIYDGNVVSRRRAA